MEGLGWSRNLVVFTAPSRPYEWALRQWSLMHQNYVHWLSYFICTQWNPRYSSFVFNSWKFLCSLTAKILVVVWGGIFQCFNHILRICSSKGHEEVSAFTHVFLQWKWKRPEIQPSAKGNLALGRNNFGWWPINWPGGYNQVIPSTLATTQYITVQYNQIHQIRIQYNLIQYFRLECHPSEFVKSQ